MKKFFIFPILLLAFVAFTRTSFAAEEEFVPCKEAEIFGEINRDLTIVINGEENPLLCEFVNKDIALANLQNIVPNLLHEMGRTYKLANISTDNWQNYESALHNLNSDIYNDSHREVLLLKTFLDIYKDNDINKEVRDFVSLYNGEVVNREALSEIVYKLPNYSPIAERYNHETLQRNLLIKPYRYFNTAAAVRHALNHGAAGTPDISGYGYIRDVWGRGKDCTNFASQVFFSGAVPQTGTWWHTKTFTGHDYSVAWKNTPAFASYMGVNYITTNHYNFSMNVAKGNIGLLDYGANGSWDHAGAVTNIGGMVGSSYRNYQIAQHSDDYIKWATTSGWPNAPRWGIVAR